MKVSHMRFRTQASSLTPTAILSGVRTFRLLALQSLQAATNLHLINANGADSRQSLTLAFPGGTSRLDTQPEIGPKFCSIYLISDGTLFPFLSTIASVVVQSSS